jgi:hypothetical protein
MLKRSLTPPSEVPHQVPPFAYQKLFSQAGNKLFPGWENMIPKQGTFIPRLAAKKTKEVSWDLIGTFQGPVGVTGPFTKLFVRQRFRRFRDLLAIFR